MGVYRIVYVRVTDRKLKKHYTFSCQFFSIQPYAYHLRPVDH